MSMQLREYQQRQHDKALAAWGMKPWWDGTTETHRSILLKQPTAGGKTITASKIIETLVSMGVRCLFCGDTDELVQQPLEKLHRATGIIASLEKAESKASLNAKVVVASVQSMVRKNRLARFPVDHFGAIFHDEAHEGPDRAAKVNERFPNARICALTATPFRINLADLSKWYSHVADELDLTELIEGGYVPPVRFHRIPLAINTDSLKMSMSSHGRDVNAEDSDSRIIPWFEAIVKALLEHGAKRQHVAFHGLCATSKKFVEICMANGLDARHVDGASPDRDDLLKGFQRRQFRLLSNASLLRKGWDCDTADSLVPLRLTKSVGLFRQQAGRILRPLDGILNGLNTPEDRRAAIAASAKPTAIIFDFLGANEEMGLVGPASLVADSEEEAKDIQRAMKKRSEADILAIRAESQRDREARLRQALESAPLRTGLLDARSYAYLLHEPALIDYVPVTQAQQQPVSDDQKKWLAWARVDPATVNSYGHASAILAINRERKDAGLLPIFAVFRLSQQGIPSPEKMKQSDADLAAGEPLWSIGKKAGTPISQMPARSKSWWLENFFNNPANVKRYPREAEWAGVDQELTVHVLKSSACGFTT